MTALQQSELKFKGQTILNTYYDGTKGLLY